MHVTEFCYQTYEIQGETVLAICDADIAGRAFRQDDIVLDAKRSFYCSKECGPIKAKRLFEQATIINATGVRAVALLVEQGLADKERVLVVEGVPHAQMVKLE
ncbi:MAG: DUF424 family protein [Candidatus Aenigmatarchaeota archaeon]|nr:MAG: DUF424 family protein [Candidatus Aenigmarchaeota archaeon]